MLAHPNSLQRCYLITQSLEGLCMFLLCCQIQSHELYLVLATVKMLCSFRNDIRSQRSLVFFLNPNIRQGYCEISEASLFVKLILQESCHLFTLQYRISRWQIDLKKRLQESFLSSKHNPLFGCQGEFFKAKAILL